MTNWNLKPGDKVVCIDDSLGDYWDQTPLKIGNVYEVSFVKIQKSSYRGIISDFLSVGLVGVAHPQEWLFGQCGFNTNRFRPVHNTSIDCFKVHLLQTPSPIKQKENVL